MQDYLGVGTNLYHKYLSDITVVEVCDGKIKADTDSRGILEFAYHDFGKVLFFEKSHASNKYKSHQEYFEVEINRPKAKLARKQDTLEKIDNFMQSNFMGVDDFFRSLEPGIISYDEYKARKIDFVRNWFIKRNEKSDETGRNLIPDNEQLEVIATVNGHVQVVARAGSGKTATLVNRALFLIEHCHIAPSSIMILVFNRNAAIEIRRRLLSLMHQEAERQIESELAAKKKSHNFDKNDFEDKLVEKVANRLGAALPYVMTFHALAYAIVHPEENLLYDDDKGESQRLSSAVQSVIDDYLQIPECNSNIQEMMLEHFRDDWDRIIAGGYNLSKAELLQLKRSLHRETLGGDYVKSDGEKLIANFLFEHDIPYNYEQNHWWNGLNYRPDFTVTRAGMTKKTGVIVEYFGLKGDADYDEMSEQKRRYWKDKPEWDLIEFSPSDIKQGDNAFEQLFTAQLKQLGITCHKLTEEEIWYRVRKRAIDRFTKAIVSFIARCRQCAMTPEELTNLIDAHTPLSRAEALFLPLTHKFYSAYLDHLSATGEEDFNGLMQRAAKLVLNGVTRFMKKTGEGDLANLRYVFIDEFQDFSDLFNRLLSSIQKVSPAVQLFCVGDDWQAINGFAGSDLRFFEHFEEVVGKFHRLYISTNYRSTRAIVDIGNALMTDLGKPAVANKSAHGMVIVADASAFTPSLVEAERYSGDIITPMVSRIANTSIAEGSSVVLLSRSNSLPWFVNFTYQVRQEDNKLSGFLNSVRTIFPKEKREQITISTAHSYKGLEKPTVIVLDALAGRYPLIHQDWVFSRVLGDSLEKTTQEERRLFYVALTRAIEKLVIITDSKNPSPFLNELQNIMSLDIINWEYYPAVPDKSSQLIVKVGNQEHYGAEPTYAIKDQLKACGYQWRSTGWPGWTKTYLAENFRETNIKREVWAKDADGVEVRIYNESEHALRIFNINRGNWVTIK